VKLLEHQAKKLLAGFGLRFTEPRVVVSAAEAGQAAAELAAPVVLKAQTPFGGRAKAGAVKFAANAAEAEHAASQLFGLEWRGNKISSVSVEPRVAFARELYVGVTWDTEAKLPVALLSLSGGVAVEDSPAERIRRRLFDPWTGFHAYEARELAAAAGLAGKPIPGLGAIFERLAGAFLSLDAVLAEINPLVETSQGEWIGLDARVEIEDDAAFRQRERLAPLGEIPSFSAGRAATPLELEARRIDAMDHRGVAGRVVEFDGDLALLIGGGGASLTVFDAIRRHHGRPANYCEIGGNPTEEKVAALTALLLGKPGTRKLAVIMNVVNNTRADVIARGVLAGLRQAGRNPAEVLSVFRVPGSWEQEARALLAGAGVTALGREVSLDAAARLAVERSHGLAA
jgi:succinyl-CoA synthetase beta subunit/citryl-CoA synthetase large subunit